ncbi:MAG TPA: glycosyltransferase family 9 protein [Caulobacteraceae bacterium]|jgi:lipopolysaccharide export system permease protein|nr:glycosyltransferase family 9 protein [Caulobacteraceae bacterium]
MKRILFISSTRIGDCILSTGLYRHLAQREPGVRITVACGPLGAPVFRAAPNLERTVVVAKSPTGHRGHWLKLWREVAGTRWDLVVDLRGSGLAYLLRAKERRLFRGETRDPVHKVVELGRVLGLTPPPDPVFWLDDKARADAAALLGDDPRPLLAVAPAAAVPVKAWAPLRSAELADRLSGPGGALEGARVLVLGGPGDASAATPLLERLGPGRTVDAVGRLDMPAAAAAVARAKLYVGADSGLGHAAAAVGAPTLSLFGPTDERRYAPWGPRVQVVRGGDDMACLDVEAAYRAAEALLARSWA